MITMNARVREMWLQALRSGEYEQGKRALRHADSFCCLGVLCDVYRRETKIGEWLHRFGDWHFLGSSESRFGFPPSDVNVWAGIDAENIFLSELVAANDSGKTFTEIAAMIEAETVGTATEGEG